MPKHNEELQAVMDRCYEWCRKCGYDMSYGQFLKSLRDNDRAVVTCGNLNYQVENGGFNQWLDNRYDSGAPYLLAMCDEIASPATKQVAELVREAMRRNDVNNRMFESNAFDPIDEDYLSMDSLDESYYAISDQFLTDVAAWYATKKA